MASAHLRREEIPRDLEDSDDETYEGAGEDDDVDDLIQTTNFSDRSTVPRDFSFPVLLYTSSSLMLLSQH